MRSRSRRPPLLLASPVIAALLVPLLAPSVAMTQENGDFCVPTPIPGRIESRMAYLTLRPVQPENPFPEPVPLDPDVRERLIRILSLVLDNLVAPTEIVVQQSELTLSAAPMPGPFYSPPVEAGLAFTARADGRLTGVSIWRRSIVPALDSAIARTLRKEELHAPIAALALSSLVDDAGVEDTIRLALDLTTRPDTLAAIRELATLDLDVYTHTPATLASGNTPPPYPETLRAQGLQGDVLTVFVVAPNGTVDMETLRIVRTSHFEFARSVRLHLPRLRYHPATLGGCTVRMWVTQPFNFRMSGPRLLSPPP